MLQIAQRYYCTLEQKGSLKVSQSITKSTFSMASICVVSNSNKEGYLGGVIVVLFLKLKQEKSFPLQIHTKFVFGWLPLIH